MSTSKNIIFKKQRQARQDLLHLIKVNQYKSNEKSYDSESKKYDLNAECERRVAKVFHIITNNINLQKNKQQMAREQSIQSFMTIAKKVTDIHFGNNSKNGQQLKAFIHLRHPITKFAKNKPIYKLLTHDMIKQFIIKCVECIDIQVLPCHFKQQADPDA